MTLPSPNLDDRKYQDFVDEAKRLIPQYCPEWTNHNLSDPGVALIELFAWMSEMILFRLNQVPDRLYTKFLDLVGIQPFPASSAHTELTFWLSATDNPAVIVPAGTVVGTSADAGPAVLFSTLEDLIIAQPTLEHAVTITADEQHHDVWEQLAYPRGTVTCFASDPVTPGDALHLGFTSSLAGNVIALDITASIEGIGVDPQKPPISWEIWDGVNWVPVQVRSDSTGGLNRDGRVELVVPLTHQPLTLGPLRSHWLRVRLLRAEHDQPTYRQSPQIRSISVLSLGGTVPAEHSDTVTAEVLGRSDGQPDQRFQLTRHPVLPRQPGETIRVITDEGSDDWEEVHDFTYSGPTDRHVSWDDGSGEITFGPRVRYADGSVRQHGAIPPAGASITVSRYRHGGGARGNVGAATLTRLRTAIPYVDRVTNLRPATGGVDPESVENAKRRGPMSLRTGERAVTAADFERLALEASPEVARARCLSPASPGGPVRLLIVPRVVKPAESYVLDDFAIDDELVAAVSAHLDERRIVGTSVEVGTPYYQGVTVAALVRALPGRPVTLVRERALSALYAYLNPVNGGPDGEGWPFDTDINAAVFAQILSNIDGVERVDDVAFFEYDLRNGTRHGPAREVIRLQSHSLFMSAKHQVVVR